MNAHAVQVRTESLTASFNGKPAVRDVSLEFPRHTVSAIIGPSGCGKSTFLRCLNRMHEMTMGASVEGRVLVGDEDIYAPSANEIDVRKRVGMVFQKPTPFPTMSIEDNVAAGLRVNGRLTKSEKREAVRRALERAALWDEVKDHLKESALALSGGQQQRLCIARAIAPGPDVVLLDEPTAALDPLSTGRIEDLIQDLKLKYTVIIVTHNMQQAARVSDYTSFFYMGSLVETGPTEQIFTNPSEERTEAYVTGRFG